MTNANGYVGIGTGTLPTNGSIRLPALGASGYKLLTITDSGGSTRDVIAMVGANVIGFGNAGTATSITGGSVVIGASNINVMLFSQSGNYGGGSGVLGIANCTTAPTTNPTGGGVLYSTLGALAWRDPSGNVVTVKDGGLLLPTAASTPANPPAGFVALWFDGTNLRSKNSSGNPVPWA